MSRARTGAMRRRGGNGQRGRARLRPRRDPRADRRRVVDGGDIDTRDIDAPDHRPMVGGAGRSEKRRASDAASDQGPASLRPAPVPARPGTAQHRTSMSRRGKRARSREDTRTWESVARTHTSVTRARCADARCGHGPVSRRTGPGLGGGPGRDGHREHHRPRDIPIDVDGNTLYFFGNDTAPG